MNGGQAVSKSTLRSNFLVVGENYNQISQRITSLKYIYKARLKRCCLSVSTH